MRSHVFVALLLVALLIPFRILGAMGFLPNFSPLPALVLCSLIFLRGRQAWLVPMAAWLVSDPLVSLIQGYPVFGPHHFGILAGMVGPVVIALLMRDRQRPLFVLGASLGAAFLFYFGSNMVSFLFDPLYPKTLDGFVQAQWTGPVGLGPTWVFLRNLAAANVLFSGLFLLARPVLPAASSGATAFAVCGRR